MTNDSESGPVIVHAAEHSSFAAPAPEFIPRGVLLAGEPAPGVPVVQAVLFSEPAGGGVGNPLEHLETPADVPTIAPPAADLEGGAPKRKRASSRRHLENRVQFLEMILVD